MAKKTRPHDTLTEAEAALADADTIAFGGVGFAGQILPATAAYQTLAHALTDRAEDVRPRLEAVLAHGSPAGRAYAATLLERVDPAAARHAWESLARDTSEVTTFTGCFMNRTTLGEYARAQLTRD